MTPAHAQGVDATSGGLIKSTLGAAAVAGAILTFVWLPAEYGIDPTGVGHLLGLTEMGEIKAQLHAEANDDVAAIASADGVGAVPLDADVIGRLDAIEAQLAAIATTVGAGSAMASVPANVESAPTRQVADPIEPTAWRDEVDHTLTPGEGIEVKLVMDEGAAADFEWTANGAVVNHDTHGDGDGQKISYEQGRSVPEQTGRLTAAFTGNHGWFWRNRTEDDVVVTLRTRGDYKELVLP